MEHEEENNVVMLARLQAEAEVEVEEDEYEEDEYKKAESTEDRDWET